MHAPRVARYNWASGSETVAFAAYILAQEVLVLSGAVALFRAVRARLGNPSQFMVGFLGFSPRQVADLVADCGGQCMRFLPSSRKDVVRVVVGGVPMRQFQFRLRERQPLAARQMVWLGRA